MYRHWRRASEDAYSLRDHIGCGAAAEKEASSFCHEKKKEERKRLIFLHFRYCVIQILKIPVIYTRQRNTIHFVRELFLLTKKAGDRSLLSSHGQLQVASEPTKYTPSRHEQSANKGSNIKAYKQHIPKRYSATHAKQKRILHHPANEKCASF